ncbi:MAG: ABC transporter permease [Candidatus Dadabacteria bacterium]|nr:MAG: ABC transporter permease [Candidatus Dadabacteria bacterium]
MWFLALRHLRSRPLQTGLTFLGIVLGGTAYIVFAGMMLGFQGDLVHRLLSLDAHIRISAREAPIKPEQFSGVFGQAQLLDWKRPPTGLHGNRYLSNVAGWRTVLDNEPHVVAWAEQLVRPALIRNGQHERNVTLIGIEPDRQERVTNLESFVIHGSTTELDRAPGLIMIGRPLLERIGAAPGEFVDVVAPNGKKMRMKVIAVFQSGTQGFDDSVVYTSITTVQGLYQRSGEISDIVVRTDDPADASAIAHDLRRLSTDKVEGWQEAHDEVMSVFMMQNIVRNTVVFIIVLVVAVGIFNILNMSVTHKRRDLAILRAMGFDGAETARLFLWQGLLLGGFGAVFALIAGYVGLHYIDQIEITTPFTSGTMTVAWDPAIFARGALLSFGASVIASWFPARAAARMTPIDIIRSTI